MIIDIHTHIFPDKIAADVLKKLSAMSKTVPFTDGTAGGLVNSSQKSEIDLSIILPVATNSSQVQKINDSSALINEKFFGKLHSFGGIYPDFSNYRSELSRIKNLGLKGIKIHPVYQDTNLNDLKFLRILERAAELDLIVVTHTGLDIGFPKVVRCSPQMARQAVKEIGNFKFVLAHMGGWKNWDEAAENLADTKVFLDTSFSTGKIKPLAGTFWQKKDLELMNEEKFLKMFSIFGADRIIFGSDSPWSSQRESLDFIKNLPIDESDKKKILGLNAASLLNLNAFQ